MKTAILYETATTYAATGHYILSAAKSRSVLNNALTSVQQARCMVAYQYELVDLFRLYRSLFVRLTL
jgi:hypothetical protein